MGLIYSQLFIKPTYPTTQLSGQTIIVTGSNVGLGLEAARHFVRLGAAKVILAVRSVDKGQAAKSSIESTTGRTGVVEVWSLDLSSYDSVKAFAAKVAELPRLDVVVENAGIAVDKFAMAEDDESTITVNVVSTFLLALLLLPVLRKSGKEFGTVPRLSIVTSEVHAWTKIPEWKTDNTFTTLSNKETADMGSRYPASKLLEVFAVRELASATPLAKEPAVIINMVNPGLCHSELARHSDSWMLYVLKLTLARTTEVGSRTLVHAGCAGAETHGEYLSACKIEEVSQFVRSEDGVKAQKKTWTELKEKLEKIHPGITATI